MSLKTLKVSGLRARRLTGLALAAGLTVSVAACGSSSHKASPKAKSPSPAVATPAAKKSTAPAPHVNLIKVTAADGKLTLSSTALHAGSYTFRETNSGKAKHALTIYGPGLTNKPTGATLTPGQTSDLIVPLKKGSYELWSPIGDDKAKGMDVHITVT